MQEARWIGRAVPAEHRAQFARLVHVAEHYADERARLEAELGHAIRGGSSAQNRLLAFALEVCGLDTIAPGMVFDAEAGTIKIPAQVLEATEMLEVESAHTE